MKKLAAVRCLFSASLLLGAGAPASPQAPSYYEFGKVVALGTRTVEVQTFDTRLHRTVQRLFALTRETRADAVHVGDNVEVIYAAAANGDLTLSRLVELHNDTPEPGPAPPAPSGNAAATSLPANKSEDAGPRPAVPARRSAPLGRASSASTTQARNAAPPLARGVAAPSSSSARPVELGSGAVSRVPGVIAVPLGVAAAANPSAPRVKGVARDSPAAECRQSVADWGTQPISLAVLDFRFPTEREESHDLGSTGGGSGTAVADLIFNRLGDQSQAAADAPETQFQLSRGDREKLYRMDFAGAARLGRRLGVDAVLLGTLSPVAVPVQDPAFPPPTQSYTLRAGVVDTCTGELLFRLSSVACPSPTPGAEADPISCPGSMVSTREAADPAAHPAVFRAPIDALLRPLEGVAEGSPAGSLGSVVAASGGAVTIRLAGGGSLHAGDQVSVHASRLAKNPTTYTLHRYVDEEIGRLTLDRVSGATASGRFVGDVPPRPGDAVEQIPEG